ncbi:MAG: hypothetical protein S0880_18065 [Actinomycetota bacterium]|nr:hypothetical protein [Actinomycetota bacterium]
MTDIATSLKEAMTINGALGAALVDYDSGMTLGTQGGGPNLNLEVAAAGNTEVVRAKLNTMRQLGIDEQIEDILLTLGEQYHLIRPIRSRKGQGLFLYLALNKAQANLAMARRQLLLIEEQLDI